MSRKTLPPALSAYLLCSTNPKSVDSSYIGKTINIARRLRQHNGEITGGAMRTKRLAPVQLVLTVDGFMTNREVLQFEWHWQHACRSSILRAYSKKYLFAKRTVNGLRLLNLPRSTYTTRAAIAILFVLLKAWRKQEGRSALDVSWSALGAYTYYGNSLFDKEGDASLIKRLVD